MLRRSFGLPVLILCAMLSLSACDSAEERAEKHFQSGLALLEQGDVDRALLELRNVFNLNGQHREARKTYARVQRERGVIEDAYGQYLLLVEQYPDDLDGRRALGEMALDRGDWPEAERHGRAARDLAPQDLGVLAINLVLDYRKALADKDEAAASRVATQAREVIAARPESALARRVLIDSLLRARDYPAALTEIDAALALDPRNFAVHETKLRVLAVQSDTAGLGAHLQQMVALFPDNTAIRDALIVWFVQTGNTDGAEDFLRAQVAFAPSTEQATLNVVQFLRLAKGPDAARQELQALIAKGGDVAVYRSLLASIDYDAGQTDAAIATMEEIVAGAAGAVRENQFKVALARMQEGVGNHVAARTRVEEVLAADPTFVPALKMRAAWLIDADRPGEAIAELRRALDQDPRDPEILTLMADAHLRDGSRELAGERLAVAVELSGQRPAEALRYARFLVEDDRLTTAETVLIDALRRAPADVSVLAALGDVYVRLPDLPRARQVADRLDTLGEPARQLAGRLRVALLVQQRKIDEGVALLQQMAAEGGDLDAPAAITRTYLQAGQPDSAARYLEDQLAKAPQDAGLRLLRAQVHLIAAEPQQAEPILRDLIAADPANDRAVRLLHGLLADSGRKDEAAALLQAGLAARPEAPDLLLLRAIDLERAGDIEGAIAVFETLYARDSDNPVVANNLASLIANLRDDPASLDRAYAISRRLRPIANPAFQDTLGWLEYRRGNHEDAVALLEPAAAGLPEDATVQLHLGLAYAALNRIEPARTTLARALALAPDPNAPPFQRAREVLAGLNGTATD